MKFQPKKAVALSFSLFCFIGAGCLAVGQQRKEKGAVRFMLARLLPELAVGLLVIVGCWFITCYCMC